VKFIKGEVCDGLVLFYNKNVCSGMLANKEDILQTDGVDSCPLTKKLAGFILSVVITTSIILLICFTVPLVENGIK
jgi:hypothetical protein